MLNQVEIFAQIPAEKLQQLENRSQVRRCPKNTILFMEGDVSDRLFIINEGLVCVHTEDAEGRQLILNYMGIGESFGELSLIDGMPRSASVTTVSDCVFTCISHETFTWFINENPEILHTLLQSLAGMVRSLTGSVKDMALLDVYGRVARVLERFCNEENKVASPKLKHHEIASMVGASREMVSRIMKELVVGGYIEMHPSYIQIKKPFPKGW